MLWNIFFFKIRPLTPIIKQSDYHLWFKYRTLTNYFNFTEPQEGPTAWTVSAGWASAHRAPLKWYPWNKGVQYTCLQAGTSREIDAFVQLSSQALWHPEQLKSFLTTKCISAHSKLECRREKTAHSIKERLNFWLCLIINACVCPMYFWTSSWNQKIRRE